MCQVLTEVKVEEVISHFTKFINCLSTVWTISGQTRYSTSGSSAKVKISQEEHPEICIFLISITLIDQMGKCGLIQRHSNS